MAQTDMALPTGKHRAGVRKMAKSSLRIDMTPMVDLGFLLISFFVIVSQLQEPTTMSIAMPKDSKDSPMPIGKSYVMTVLLDGDKNYCYEGPFDEAVNAGQVSVITGEQLRGMIIQKQRKLDNKLQYKEGRNGLMLLVKPSAQASYKSIIDMLDECTITGVKKYALLKPDDKETDYLSKASQKQ